jgi:hypothetical protein
MLVKAHLDDLYERMKTISLAKKYTKQYNNKTNLSAYTNRPKENTSLIMNHNVLSAEDSTYHFLR